MDRSNSAYGIAIGSGGRKGDEVVSSLEMNFAGERFTLFADKAMFWQATETLIIADPHFGKAAAFRHAGLAVPENVTGADLDRLDHLLNMTCSRRLFILGDFFHAKSGRGDATMQTLGEWCGRRRTLETWLMPGNHDKSSGAPPECWKIRTVAAFKEGPFTFAHEPDEREDTCVIAGHLHPCITLGETYGRGLRAPCFWFRRNSVVMPAFGSFTGTHPIAAERGNRVVAIDGVEIFEVPGSLLR